MSSVGSLSSSTSTSIRGYGGLASGLDRDELIKGMTIGTTNKITQQEQKKQQLQWKQEAVQSISSSMIDFHSKYTETLTSPTNLFSSMLWGRNKITTSGANSKYVSVTGTASAADAITIMGVKQKAEDARWSSSNGVSSGVLNTGRIKIDFSGDGRKYTVENLIGTNLEFKYGGSSYSIYLRESDDYDYSSAADIAKAVNDLLSKQTTSDDKKLSDIIQAEVTADGKFGLKDVSGGNPLELTGGTALKFLGLREAPAEGEKEGKVLNGGTITAKAEDLAGTVSSDIITKVSFYDYVAGKSLNFSYNGSSTTVKLPDAGKLEAAADAIIKDTTNAINDKNDATVKAIANSIQEQLDKAFGKGRIKVNGDNGELSFKTTIPGGADDDSSIFKLTGGDLALIGDKKGALQSADATATDKKSALHVGDTTRLNLTSSVEKSGLSDGALKAIFGADYKTNGQASASFTVNGTEITFSKTDSVESIMKQINEKVADVTVSYQEAADKFTFTSSEKGASGAIKFDAVAKGVVENLFGMNLGTSKTVDGKEVYEKRGQDAIVSVKYAGSDEVVNLRRDSNSFTVDGLTIGVKGTFNTECYGTNDVFDKSKMEPGDEIEIDASVDVDKVYDTIKSFVDSYNSIVDMVNTQLTTKHEKDYDPLTSDQKSQLSDDEVEKWEAKAKEGLLYGDSDLRSLSMDLRVVVSGGLLEKFKDIGITVSSTYSDNGKLSIDESKLRGALQTDPESVQKLFTSEAGVDENNNQTFNGLATNLKSVMNKYVNTTGAMESKGILIRKAGSKSSALSLTQNTYYSQMKSIDEALEKLKAKLKTEQDRYISQFSTLETLIANMNSQSSYLSSMSGY